MKILLSGASGFLGKEMLSSWNDHHEVITLGRSSSLMITCDLSTTIPDLPPVDMVVHAAGKAHIVPKTDEEKNDFFNVNVLGTINLLEALKQNQLLKKFVYISSVSVYGLSHGNNINENAPLLARDPYGKSKIEAEKLISEWCIKRRVEYYILRLPLIAGKNPPGNLGAMIKGIKSRRYLSIGKATARKSVVWAEDVAKLIPSLSGHSGIFNLTDGYHPCFKEIENVIARAFHKKNPLAIHMFLANIIGLAGNLLGKKSPVNSDKIKKITASLTFDDTKARKLLYWQPTNVILKLDQVL